MLFGWKKDKYKPQLTHNHFLVSIGYDFSKPLPDHVDLGYLMPEVRDQGNLGACTGFGIGVNVTARAKEQGVYIEWFSPTWIYNGERFIEGTLTEDAGAGPSDGWDWLTEKGCLLEHFWPYKDILDTKAPPSKFDQDASKFPVHGYRRVDNGIKGLMLSLSVGNLISIGTPWYDKWMDAGTDGRLADISNNDTIAGGHETCLFGYKMIGSKIYFHGRNSWSDKWGEKGNYWMPAQAFDVFKNNGGYDAHFPVLPWHK